MDRLKKIVVTLTISAMVLAVAPSVGAVTAEELLAQIQQLQQQLNQLMAQYQQLTGQQATTTVPAACQGVSFERNLKQGMSGNDVKCLQALLNTDPATKVAESGAGSPGNETTFFGPKTKAAVVKFQEKYAADILTPVGLTAGTGFVGAKTRAKLNSILATGAPSQPPTGEGQQPPAAGLTVELAADTPAASTLIAGQALADLAHFKFTNGDAKEVKVTQLKLKRIGISSDTTLSEVYLYEGNTRLTDLVTISSGYASFNDPTGLFKVDAGKSVTITVKANIADQTAGQTVGVSINSSTDVVSDASAVNGTFPVSGNLQSIATANLATVLVGTASGGGDVTPGETNFNVWQSTLNVSERDVQLKYLRLRQIGSIAANDLQNFKLYVDDSQVGEMVQMSSDYYVSFDLTANPVTLKAGNRTLTVKADIIGGSGRNYSFSLQRAVDIVLVDSEFGVNIKATGTIPATTSSGNIASGTITVARAADSPSGTVVKDASNVPLARYELKAFGEAIKVETLTVRATSTNDTSVTQLRNGRLYANGVQIGSTQNITNTGTFYSLGSALIVQPGSPVTLEVRADIFDSDSTNDISDGDIIYVTLVAGNNNAQAQNSLTLLSVPGSDLAGNTVTVGVGALTGAKSSYGDQNTVGGVSNYKIGSYVLTAGSAEDINITGFTVGVGGTASSTNLSNLYVKYGANTTTPKGSVSASNSFSVSYTLAKDQQLAVDVYVDLGTGLAVNDTVTTTLAVTARGKETGTDASITTAIPGQTITIVEPTITASLDPSRPDAAIVVAEGSNVILARYKFRAENADIGIKNLRVVLTNSTSSRSLVNLGLDSNNDGTPEEKRAVTGVTTTFPSLFTAPAGQDKIVAITADLANVTSALGNSGDDLQIRLAGYTYVVGGVEQSTTTSATGTSQIIRNTKPDISNVGIASTVLSNGTKELLHFTLSANNHANVDWASSTFEITLYDSQVASTTDPDLNLKLSNIRIVDGAGNTISSTSTATTTQQSVTVPVTLGPAAGQTNIAEIPAGQSKTFYLKADVTGSAENDSVTTKLNGFVWGDQVATGIDETYVPGIPTDSFSMSR